MICSGHRRQERNSAKRIAGAVATADAPVAYNDMNWIEDLLDVIADPKHHLPPALHRRSRALPRAVPPGAIIPATVGVICLLLASSRTVLPFNWRDWR